MRIQSGSWLQAAGLLATAALCSCGMTEEQRGCFTDLHEGIVKNGQDTESLRADLACFMEECRAREAESQASVMKALAQLAEAQQRTSEKELARAAEHVKRLDERLVAIAGVCRKLGDRLDATEARLASECASMREAMREEETREHAILAHRSDQLAASRKELSEELAVFRRSLEEQLAVLGRESNALRTMTAQLGEDREARLDGLKREMLAASAERTAILARMNELGSSMDGVVKAARSSFPGPVPRRESGKKKDPERASEPPATPRARLE
jgi:hypothetical protein